MQGQFALVWLARNNPVPLCQSKSPGPGPGAWFVARRSVRDVRSEPREDRARESVVQAGAHNVLLEGHIVRDRAAGAVAVELAEVGVEIFDLGGPVAEEGVFEAAADRPAGHGVARAGR